MQSDFLELVEKNFQRMIKPLKEHITAFDKFKETASKRLLDLCKLVGEIQVQFKDFAA